MTTDFVKNQLAIDSLRIWLSNMETNVRFVRSSDYDPLAMGLKAFSELHTPQDVATYILNGEADADSAFYLSLVENSIERLETALVIIEAQRSLSLQIHHENEMALAECRANDEAQTSNILAQASKAFSTVKHYNLPREFLIYEVGASLSSVVDNLHSLAEGRVDSKLLNMNELELTRKIGDMRVDYSTLEIDLTDAYVTRAGMTLDHAIYLTKARDEGIIPPSAHLDEEIERRLQLVEKTISESRQRLDQTERFMAEVHYMDKDHIVAGQFIPTQYTPVSIGMIPQFTP